MAAGSSYELHPQLRLARDLGYLQGDEIFEQVNEAERVLNGLIRSLEPSTSWNP